MERVTLEMLRRQALDTVRDIDQGGPLAPLPRALIALGVAAVATSLDQGAISATINEALDCGATLDQVEEVIALVSGLGVHSLMSSQAILLTAAQERGLAPAEAALDADRQELWDQYVGDDPFWIGFEQENPGFLRAMLLLSPALFKGFFEYCAIPWNSGTVKAKVKELIAMASDATPTHRFGPGFRLHLRNAIALGASRTEILEALDIAAAAPEHLGVR
jgi:alkylhydroperoxidase/carboxymuconolactone decarboxylase family protein YurZ